MILLDKNHPKFIMTSMQRSRILITSKACTMRHPFSRLGLAWIMPAEIGRSQALFRLWSESPNSLLTVSICKWTSTPVELAGFYLAFLLRYFLQAIQAAQPSHGALFLKIRHALSSLGRAWRLLILMLIDIREHMRERESIRMPKASHLSTQNRGNHCLFHQTNLKQRYDMFDDVSQVLSSHPMWSTQCWPFVPCGPNWHYRKWSRDVMDQFYFELLKHIQRFHIELTSRWIIYIYVICATQRSKS